MDKDYRFKILSFLFENPSTESPNINIRPLINSLIQSSNHSSTYFGTLLNTMSSLKDGKREIWCDGQIYLSVKQGLNAPPDMPIMARLEPFGIEEYYRLKQLYNSFQNVSMNKEEKIQLEILSFLNTKANNNLSLEGNVDAITENSDFKRADIEKEFLELRDEYKCITQSGNNSFNVNEKGKAKKEKLLNKSNEKPLSPEPSPNITVTIGKGSAIVAGNDIHKSVINNGGNDKISLLGLQIAKKTLWWTIGIGLVLIVLGILALKR